MTSPKQQLLDFAAGLGPGMIVSPLDSGNFTKSVKNIPWHVPQDDPDLINAMLDNAEECGYPPVIKFETGCLDLLTPATRIIEDTSDRKVMRKYYDTPFGEYGSTITYIANAGHAEPDKYSNEEAIKINTWVYKNLSDWNAFDRKISSLISQIGERGLFCLNLGHPFYALGDITELIFLHYDNPELIRENIQFFTDSRKKMIDIAIKNNCRCFFLSGISRNLLSPEMIEAWIVPYSRQISDYIKASHGICYLHDCGNMQQWFDSGYYQQIAPHWIEGCEAPPTGNVSNFRALRESLPESIVLKGNLNLDMLCNGTPEDVAEATKILVEQVGEYRHIFGGACSILKGTPQANIRAIVETVEKSQN